MIKLTFINRNVMRIDLEGSIEAKQSDIDTLNGICTATKYNIHTKESDYKSYIYQGKDGTKYTSAGFLMDILRTGRAVCTNADTYVGTPPSSEAIDRFIEQTPLNGIYRTPHSFQRECLKKLLTLPHCKVEEAPSAGKTWIIYMLSRYLMEQETDVEGDVLIITTLYLCNQMSADFEKICSDGTIKTSYCTLKKKKDKDERVVRGNIGSLCNKPLEWFRRFKAVIIDETHMASSDSYTKVMDMLTACKCQRFMGLTGTFDEKDKMKMLIYTAYLGETVHRTTPKELEDMRVSAKTVIRGRILSVNQEDSDRYWSLYSGRKADIDSWTMDNVVLTSSNFERILNSEILYGDNKGQKRYMPTSKASRDGVEYHIFNGYGKTGKYEYLVHKITDRCTVVFERNWIEDRILDSMRDMAWLTETDFLNALPQRREAIAQEIALIEDNQLCFFHRKDACHKFADFLRERFPEKSIYVITGDVKIKDRERICGEVNVSKNCVIVSMYSVMSTGVSVPSLAFNHYVDSIKADNSIRQSNGRVIRLFEGKDEGVVVDWTAVFKSPSIYIPETVKLPNMTFFNQYKERKAIAKKSKFEISEIIIHI